MRALFRKYLVPHPENDYRPHALRWEAVSLVCAIALAGELAFLSGASYLAPHSRLFGIILASALVDGTNQNRVADSLPSLRVNPLLQAAAQEKADDMAKNGYFAHTSPSGITPWYWFGNVGYNFTYAGENLAVNFSDSADVTNAWMNSPGHRANILNDHFTEIGIATAEGEYQGVPAIYVAELFGTPMAAAPAALASKTPPVKSLPAPAVKPARPSPASVATSNEPVSQPNFVAIKGAETAPAPQPDLSKIVPQNNPIQNAFSAPRRLANGFYFLLIGLFAAVVFVNLYLKLHLRDPRLIANGAAVIAVALVCAFANQYFAGDAGAGSFRGGRVDQRRQREQLGRGHGNFEFRRQRHAQSIPLR